MASDLIKGGELILFGTVGNDFFGDGFTSLSVVDALAELDGDIMVRINSWGGAVNEGVAIYTALKAHKGEVTVRVDGVAASSASVIAMAAKELIIPTSSMLMIHNASGFTFGDVGVHEKQIGVLGKFDGQLANIYAKRADITKEEARQFMVDETWMTGEEALEFGFADSAPDMADQDAISNQLDQRLNFYAHLPDHLRAVLNSKVETRMPKENIISSGETVIVAPPTEPKQIVLVEGDVEMEARIRAELTEQHQQVIAACNIAGMPEKSLEFIASGKSVAAVLTELQTLRSANEEVQVQVNSQPANEMEDVKAMCDQVIAKINRRVAA